MRGLGSLFDDNFGKSNRGAYKMVIKPFWLLILGFPIGCNGAAAHQSGIKWRDIPDRDGMQAAPTFERPLITTCIVEEAFVSPAWTCTAGREGGLPNFRLSHWVGIERYYFVLLLDDHPILGRHRYERAFLATPRNASSSGELSSDRQIMQRSNCTSSDCLSGI